MIDYFRLPSLKRYLIVRVENQVIVHHSCGENGIILTRIVRDGPIMLDLPCFPPGVS